MKKASQKKILQSKPWSAIKQPENYYARFTFDVWFLNLNGKKTKHLIAAFSTKLAEKQAKNLAFLYGWEVCKIIKRDELPKPKYYKG